MVENVLTFGLFLCMFWEIKTMFWRWKRTRKNDDVGVISCIVYWARAQCVTDDDQVAYVNTKRKERKQKVDKKWTKKRRRERERENQKGETQATERTANEPTYDSLTMFTYDILMSVCLLACFFSCGRSQFLTFIIIFVSLSLRLAALFRSRTVYGLSVWRAVCVMWVHQCVCERERERPWHIVVASPMFNNNTCVLCAA